MVHFIMKCEVTQEELIITKLNLGSVLNNDFWTPPLPLLSILYIDLILQQIY